MNETVNTHKKMEELDRMSIPYEAIPPSEWKRNAYDSNNSVSIDTLRIFYKCARDLEKIIEEQEGDEKEVEEYIINLLSLILTQKLHLIVYHDRWLYFFNGKYFEPCPSNQELRCILRELCEAAAYLWKRFSVHDKTVKRLLSHVQQNAVKVDYPPDISKYVVFENGVLNLDTLELEDFTPQKFFTSMIHADWLAENKACPEYEKVINTYTNHETPLNKRINEVLGVCLTNDMVKKLFCFLGVTNSGKTFLLSFLMRLFNNSATVTMQPNDLGRQFAPSMVYGKSLCCCMDMDSAPLNTKATAFLKGISGADMLSAEFKGENGNVPFQSRAHIINASNYDITTKMPDAAFDMRKLVIPFKYRLTDNAEPFEVLMDKLEREKAAIVRKLILAYKALKDNHYEFSDSEEGESYDSYVPPTAVSRSTSKSLDFFFTACYVRTENDDDYIFTEDMYADYKEYALDESYAYCFPNYDAFAKAVRAELQLKSGRKRKESDANPKRCYLGIKRKALVTEEQAAED